MEHLTFSFQLLTMTGTYQCMANLVLVVSNHCEDFKGTDWSAGLQPHSHAMKGVAWPRGQRAEARRTTILQPVEQKPHSQKDRQNEKAEGYVPH